MNRRDALWRGGLVLGGALGLAGCTEQALEDAEGKPPFVEESSLTPEEADLPADRVHVVVEEGIEQAADADIGDLESLEGFLDEQGLAVGTLEEAEGIIEAPLEDVDEDAGEEVVDQGNVEERLVEATIVELEYALENWSEGGMAHTLGLVAGGYAALLEAGHDAELLEATVLDAADVPFGAYEVEGTWAEEYNAGKRSAAEYGDEVLTTLETN